MKEPRWEYQTPDWENKTSEEYKIKYFLKHCYNLANAIERQEQELNEINREYWTRAHYLALKPPEIINPDLDLEDALN